MYGLGAHFDTTIDCPGADDNASGVAAMLEVMRVLSNYHFKNDIVFVGFDLEEYGCIGSNEYVSSIIKSKRDSLIGFINFDMIGYYSEKENSQYFPPELMSIYPEAYQNVAKNKFKGDFAINILNEASADLGGAFVHLSSQHVPDLKLLTLSVERNGQSIPSFRRSDHATFWDHGFRAIYLGDGADTRNPSYHAPSDSLETLDYTRISLLVKSTIATLATLSGIQRRVSTFSAIPSSPQLSNIFWISSWKERK
jgi:Zn-dependent M28 family amino/carboxypeptidase